MTCALITLRVAVWTIFIAPLCVRLLLNGNPAAALALLIVGGIFINIVTRTDD